MGEKWRRREEWRRKFSQCQMEKQLATCSLLWGWIFLLSHQHTHKIRQTHTYRNASCHSTPPVQHLVIKEGPRKLYLLVKEGIVALDKWKGSFLIWLLWLWNDAWLSFLWSIFLPELNFWQLIACYIFLCFSCVWGGGRHMLASHTHHQGKQSLLHGSGRNEMWCKWAGKLLSLIQVVQQKGRPWPTHVIQNCWAPSKIALWSHWMQARGENQ